MDLSKKCEYAFRALIKLAIDYKQGADVTLISEIAEKEGIPPRYLEQILLRLKNQGILFSKRGVGGGYALRKSPEYISMGDVIRAVDASFAQGEQAYTIVRKSSDEISFALNAVIQNVSAVINETLDNISLKDMAKRALDLIESKQKVLNYVI